MINKYLEYFKRSIEVKLTLTSYRFGSSERVYVDLVLEPRIETISRMGSEAQFVD